MLQTEFDFTLPLGYVDGSGSLHRDGVMRLATAADEILPLRDPRVQGNEAYLVVILMSRVITRLGSLERVTPQVVEGLFAADLTYLQDLYNSVNRLGEPDRLMRCPQCGHAFPGTGEASPLGASVPTQAIS